MDAVKILMRYLDVGTELYKIVYSHSRSVANKALEIVKNHPELNADALFIEESSLIHDIGVVLTDAPSICCFGKYPYICHGFLGREIMDKEGYPKHALVCERHTGTGLSVEIISKRGLPLPLRDMMPLSIEEQIICFSDLFYSKTNLENERSIENVRIGLEKYDLEGVQKFDEWCKVFL